MTLNDWTIVLLLNIRDRKSSSHECYQNRLHTSNAKRYVTQRKDVHVKPSTIVQQAQCSPHESNKASPSHRHPSSSHQTDTRQRIQSRRPFPCSSPRALDRQSQEKTTTTKQSLASKQAFTGSKDKQLSAVPVGFFCVEECGGVRHSPRRPPARDLTCPTAYVGE